MWGLLEDSCVILEEISVLLEEKGRILEDGWNSIELELSLPEIEAGKSLAGILLEQMWGLLEDSCVILEEVSVLLEETGRILEDGWNGIKLELNLPEFEAGKVLREFY